MHKSANPFFDTKDRVWHGGIVNPCFTKDVSLGHAVLSTLRKNSNKVIQVCDTTGETLTCHKLATLSIRVAQYLQHTLGLQQGDIIGTMASNTTFLTPIVLGAFLTGITVSPAYHAMNRDELILVFGLTKPKVIFCDADCYNELANGLSSVDLQCKIYIIKGQINGIESVHEILRENRFQDDFTPVELRNGGEQTAAILCTSGTTGVPKAVCLCHQACLSRISYSLVMSNDINFTFSSIYWISGFYIFVLSALTGALRVITDRSFSPEYFLELIEKYKITFLITTSPVISLLTRCPDIARRDLSSVKSFIYGGSSLSGSVVEKINKHLREHILCEAYGLTELGGIVSVNRLLKEKEGSVGQLISNMRAKIISKDGKPMGIGELGEVRLKGACKWSGYYRNTESTRSAVDSQDWFRSGDLGYFDEDGFLFICGRLHDMLRHRHILIAPREIEEVIQKIPEVVEVCVFGMRDQKEHDLVTAAVVKSDTCELTEEDICKTVANCLPEIKHLRGGVFFVQELPRTPTGKVQRHKLQALLV